MELLPARARKHARAHVCTYVCLNICTHASAHIRLCVHTYFALDAPHIRPTAAPHSPCFRPRVCFSFDSENIRLICAFVLLHPRGGFKRKYKIVGNANFACTRLTQYHFVPVAKNNVCKSQKRRRKK